MSAEAFSPELVLNAAHAVFTDLVVKVAFTK
jgi:hypothetical protein